MASLSENSLRQYDSCFKKWFNYCNHNNIDLFEISIPNVILFLTQLFNEGAQFGTLNSCRSALSLISGNQIGNDDRIKRFFKGVYRLRPALPKYNNTWDTSIVLNFLSNWYPNIEITFENLTKKLITLLALVTAHRMQTLSKINILNIEKHSLNIVIKIPEFIKTSRNGSLQPTLTLPFFNQNPALCPCKTLTDYIERSKNLRGNQSKLFISFRKPYCAVGPQTLSRWTKSVLEQCGIDVSIFTAHSTRHAATSKARKLGANLDLIRKTAGWSGSSQVFGRFYNRVTVDNEPTDNNTFGIMILSNSVNDDTINN